MLPMLGVLFKPFSETGRCFLLLLMLASCSGSTRCCQQVTLAKKPVLSDVTELSLLCSGAAEAPRTGGMDLVEAVFRTDSTWDEVDLVESRLTRLVFEDDFFVEDSTVMSAFEEVFLSLFSPFSLAFFTCLGTEDRRYGSRID